MADKAKKGKVGTKGNKQIIDENISTLQFYRNMAIAANAITLVLISVFSPDVSYVMMFIAIATYIGSYQFMAYMARPQYSDSGQILSSGIDLNMEGAVAENFKDLIILTSICQVLSCISLYFWFLWLFAPARAAWIVWKNILSPYFFQQQEPEPEVNEKKQKKMERKMRRMQH